MKPPMDTDENKSVFISVHQWFHVAVRTFFHHRLFEDGSFYSVKLPNSAFRSPTVFAYRT